MSLSRVEVDLVAMISAGKLELAMSTAGSMGWLGKPKNREREEFEAKCVDFNIIPPWKVVGGSRHEAYLG
jgi:hypothetical protein